MPNEATLQQLIKEHPEVLPLNDLGDAVPPLLIVGRESRLGNGAVGVIGVDADGGVTVIECKLDRNPEVKRTVVGQVLGYGAYLWRMSYEAFENDVVRPYFDNPRQRHRQDHAVPTLIGVPKPPVRPPPSWTRERFFETLGASASSDERAVADDLMAFGEDVSGKAVEWGTGRERGSFTARLRLCGKGVSLFSVYTTNQFSANLGWNTSLDAATKERYRDWAKARLSLTFDQTTWERGWPMTRLSHLVPEAQRAAFKAFIRDAVAETRRTVQGDGPGILPPPDSALNPVG